MIHSFLLIGQSNMAGRGVVTDVEPISRPDLLVLRNGRWHKMYQPVNPDRASSGVCLAESFAAAYADSHGVQVGLIPCADGGTSLDQWVPGGLLFDHAVMMSRLAQRTSTIAGVLWHQGEADCADDRWPLYAAKCTRIFDALRRELDLYDVPFLLGGLGDYLPLYGSESLKNYAHVNDQLQSMADTLPMTGFVSAEGLKPKPDNLHFNAEALREFGLRYYKKFLELEKNDKIFEEKPLQDAAIRTEMELL